MRAVLSAAPSSLCSWLGRGDGRARAIARKAVVNKAFRDAARRCVCYKGYTDTVERSVVPLCACDQGGIP